MMHVQSWSRRLSAIALSALSIIALVWCLQVGTAGAVDLFGEACKAGGKDSAACQSTNDDIVSRTVGRVTNLVTYIAGIVAVVTIMIGGYMYLTSGGDASKVGEAKNAIIFSIVGIVVVVLARFIILFVIDRV